MAVSLTACASSSANRVRISEGHVPTQFADDDARYREESLRMVQELQTQGAVWDDPWFQDEGVSLIRQIVPEDLQGKHQGIQFRLVKAPSVNAFTVYSGDIFFHTGLISRLTHPDQLAFVAAHEISHWENRDVLYFMRSYRSKTVAAQILDLALVPVDALVTGGLSNLTLNLVYGASVTGYGREQESRSDQEALLALEDAGYDLSRSTETFHIFMQEHEKYDQGRQSASFLLSHPSNERRVQDITAQLAEQGIEPSEAISFDESFVRDTRHIRLENAALNIGQGRSFHALDDLQVLFRINPKDPQALYQRGEAYRVAANNFKRAKGELSKKHWKELFEGRAEEEIVNEWRRSARAAFEESIDGAPFYAEPHKGLGLLLADQASGEPEARLAKEELQKYLDMMPDARDRRFVASRIRTLEETDE
ncbi:MAG: M48 family metalloprotease [Candidatus Omnitrophica bacterium]|nr:M48 family metalloprotease [Candidatus Omnitrophota bacterium]